MDEGIRRASRFGRWLGRACGVVVLAGCGGVSVRYVVESDMRFEHCYRIDEDPNVTLETKRACWSEWHERYERGQDANRIAYAGERLRVLDAAAATGTTTSSPPVAVAATVQGCPNPNSPYAPPPSTATSGIQVGMSAAPPDVTCGDKCNRDWKNCGSACNGVVECLSACDDKLRGCMKGCF